MGRGVKNWPISPRKVLPRKALEGNALDVFAGVGQVVAFEKPHDLKAGGGFQVQAFVFGEDAVRLVVRFRLPEQVFKGIVGNLLFKERDGEQVVAPLPALQAAFDVNLDEQNFGDFVERRHGVYLLAIPDDVVALVQQVGELVFLEGLQAGEKRVNLLVGGVGVGDVLDFFQVAGHAILADAPEPGFRVVVGDEEGRVRQAGIVVALGIILAPDRYVVGLAFNDDERRFLPGFVWYGAPHDKVGAGVRGAAPRHVCLLGDLFQVVAVFVQQDEQVFLADGLFRRFDEPLAPDVAPYLAGFALQGGAILGDVLGSGFLDLGLGLLHAPAAFLPLSFLPV